MGTKKTLVVDDDPFICRLLVRQLHSLGLEDVGARERASEAVELLKQEPDAFGLVLCDLQMPEMDGIEFIRHLVHLGYKGGLLLVSGEDERVLLSAERLARSHRLRVLGTLFKPVSTEQLQRLLGQALPEFAEPQDKGDRRDGKSYGADELARAIEAGELVNHYQPQVDFATAQVVGVETLVRWQHPADGLVFPDRFVCLAEDAGLIDALMRRVLRDALRDTRRWHDQGLHLKTAVNISMDNLQRLDLPEFVEQEGRAAGVPLSSLVLEVTETHLMKNPQACLDILTRLRLRRVALAIDDFGTGHSSLAQLRDIPFNELKIDRGFVHEAWLDSPARTLLASSLEIARKLGMKTVAEGVETRADWDYLRSSGCEVAQGWLIAKAMPADQLPGWVEDWNKKRRPEFTRPLPSSEGA